MPEISEAAAMMPTQRFEDIFGRSGIEWGAPAPGRIGMEPHEWRREIELFREIPNSFDTDGGSWRAWSKGDESVGDINQWAHMVRTTREAIANTAGIDPEKFQTTMNTWWTTFGRKHSTKCPGLVDFYDIDREVAFKIAFPDYPLEFAIGYGGTNDRDFTSRTLGWAVPGLDFIQTFADLDLPAPTLRLFFAHELSSYVNHLDTTIARNVSAASARALKAFVKEFYPVIEDQVQISQPALEQIQASLGVLGINGTAPAILERAVEASGDSKLAKQVARLYMTGEQKGSDHHGTALYVMGHLIPEIFGTYVDPQTGPISVIKGGGPSEADFTALQRAIAPTLSSGVFARTHAHDRHALGNIARQAVLVGKNSKKAPYYADPSANDIRVTPGSTQLEHFNKDTAPDRDTGLAATRTGSVATLAAFIESTMVS